MKCNTCGRNSQNEEANFCDYCGSSFKEHTVNVESATPRDKIFGGNIGQEPEMAMNPAPSYMNNTSTAEKQMAFTDWLVMYGVLLVPILNVVMLFIWAFDQNAPKVKKDWAKATLIFIGVAVIIAIILIIAYAIWIMSTPMYQDMLEQMSNGTFDYNNYLSGTK